MTILADQCPVRLLFNFGEKLQESTCGNSFNFTRTALSQTGLLTSHLEQLVCLDTGPYWCQNSSGDDEAEEEEDEPVEEAEEEDEPVEEGEEEDESVEEAEEEDESVEEAEEEDESVEEAEEEVESVGEAEEETDHFRARDMLPLQVSGRD